VLEPPSYSPAERALLAGLDRFEGRIAVLQDQDVEAAGVGRVESPGREEAVA
jgi:hypothetical protein